MQRSERLDPAARGLLEMIDQLGGAGLSQMTPAEARSTYDLFAGLAGDGAEVASVVEREIEGVSVIVSMPVLPPGSGTPGVMVWIHGGGWVIGNAASSQGTARDIAANAGCIVVNVDYGLAPENPFPGPIDECVRVVRWLRSHADEIGGDPERVAVGGDSAGGNLSAVVAHEVPGLALQVLIYPGTDMTMSHPSIDENADGYFLDRQTMNWFRAHYLAGADPTDVRLSPLFAPADLLAASPPALVITAEFDPLRDEGAAYVSALREAGVHVDHTFYPGQIHGFVTMPTLIPDGATAMSEICEAVRDALDEPAT